MSKFPSSLFRFHCRYVKSEAGGYEYGYAGGYGQLYNPYMHYGEQPYEHQQQQYNPAVHEQHAYQQQQHYGQVGEGSQHYGGAPVHNGTRTIGLEREQQTHACLTVAVYKEDQTADPYSFVDEAGGARSETLVASAPKKRGRKKKVKEDE